MAKSESTQPNSKLTMGMVKSSHSFILSGVGRQWDRPFVPVASTRVPVSLISPMEPRQGWLQPWPATEPASRSWPLTRNSVTLPVQHGMMKARPVQAASGIDGSRVLSVIRALVIGFVADRRSRQPSPLGLGPQSEPNRRKGGVVPG